MDRENIRPNLEYTASELGSIRNSLLVVTQSGDAHDLSSARSDLVRLADETSRAGDNETADLVRAASDILVSSKPVEGALKALDMIARVEAIIWRDASRVALDDVSNFVDASFGQIAPGEEPEDWTVGEFEIDEETLEIFRSEAEDLLSSIFNELEKLAAAPADTTVLWNIRRSAHTFKGSAGIVGMSEASETAHRMEDLLDKMVELRVEANVDILEFLDASAMHLNALVTAKNLENDPDLDRFYEAAIRSVNASDAVAPDLKQSTASVTPALSGRPDRQQAVAVPIVRVALDRLDELLDISRKLIANRISLADGAVDFEEALNSQQHLMDEMFEKLQRIRMVRFGTLETRLSRAVQVTSVEEGKKARIEIENGDVEMDTQIIDALVEPLLHLLKNSVVHGIEPPETRRLLGKRETGSINVRIEADDEAAIITISDDGAGISVPKVKGKAVSNGTISAGAAQRMSDRDAIRLIFDRGLTTADKIDLNAGRGVGMGIVKESLESRGGSVHVESEPQRGTTFTLFIPKNAPQPAVPAAADAVAQDPAAAPLVLIVDDSASVRRQTQKIVAAAGLRTITANSGAEALELLLNGTVEPDLILSDVEMPYVDGWEMLEYIKTDENFGHIPVVMVTSLDSEEHQTRAAKLGASGYVIKPFAERDLTNTLESLGLLVTA